MNCELLRSRAEVFLDGELPANQMLELEGHLEQCHPCRVQLEFRTCIRETTRQVVLGTSVVQPSLEQRMRCALQEEATKELAHSLSGTEDIHQRRRPRVVRLFTFGGALAAAACLALFVGTLARSPGSDAPQLSTPGTVAEVAADPAPVNGAAGQEEPRRPLVVAARQPTQAPLYRTGSSAQLARPVTWSSSPTNSRGSSYEDATTDELLDGVIELHSAPPEDQITEPRAVGRLARDVGVAVDLPRLMEEEYGAHFQGGSVVRMRNNQVAARLRYHTPDNRSFTIYIYDPNRLPIHAALDPSRLFEEPVYVGHRRGYSIAATKQYGVGYAVASDLNASQSARLIRKIAYGNTVKH